MKLTELNNKNSRNYSKIMENQFGSSLATERLTHEQARVMLTAVTRTLNEYRQMRNSGELAKSQPYLKAIMVEQALRHRLSEMDDMDPDTVRTVQALDRAEKGQTLDPQQTQALGKVAKQALGLNESTVMELMAMCRESGLMEGSCTMKEAMAKCNECARREGGARHMMIFPMAERKEAARRMCKAMEGRMIREASEVETAQVVLAAQDMVSRVQGMIEDVSEMQFKELPALVDSIKYEMSTEKAQQFQQSVQGALQTLLQGLQEQKTALDGALGGLTGQEVGGALPDLDGADMGAGPGEELDIDVDATDDLDDELSLDQNLDMDADVGSPESLGRGRK